MCRLHVPKTSLLANRTRLKVFLSVQGKQCFLLSVTGYVNEVTHFDYLSAVDEVGCRSKIRSSDESEQARNCSRSSLIGNVLLSQQPVLRFLSIEQK